MVQWQGTGVGCDLQRRYAPPTAQHSACHTNRQRAPYSHPMPGVAPVVHLGTPLLLADALRGKPLAISRIRQRNPYNTITMIGDGITDLEAVQVGVCSACATYADTMLPVDKP